MQHVKADSRLLVVFAVVFPYRIPTVEVLCRCPVLRPEHSTLASFLFCLLCHLDLGILESHTAQTPGRAASLDLLLLWSGLLHCGGKGENGICDLSEFLPGLQAM